MGIITFFLLGTFTLLYMSKTWQGRPEFVDKAVAFINDNIDNLALAGIFYGLIAAILTPLRVPYAIYMLIHLAANLLIFVMALPYGFDKLVAKFDGKLNEAVVGEFRNFVSFIAAREKAVGIAGCIFAVLVFSIVFR